MYFVDREKIEATLSFIDEQLLLLKNNQSWETKLEKAALERICQTVIEGMLDVGNGMIDGFIMRDPGSYEDIIDILEDEKVITPEMSSGFKKVIQLRKNLVQEYIKVDHGTLLSVFQEQMGHLEKFSSHVKEYLNNELGPVSAFKN